MADSGGAEAGCCARCFGFVITSGLAALFLWLSLRTSNPTISLTQIYLPALNTSLRNSSQNHTVLFTLQLKNNMRDKGVHYSNTTLTFSFRNSSSNVSHPTPIANYSIPSFYQGHQKKARRTALLDASAAHGVDWEGARGALANGSSSTVGLRLDLVTKVKFKILVWYTKKHTLVLGADVEVNGSGTKVNEKGVKLKKSGAGGGVRGVALCRVFFLLFFIIIIML